MSSYDVIFAGGGTAACVAASRLAKADPSLKILVLEAGPHTQEKMEHVQPARYFRQLALPAQTFSFHISQPSEALANRRAIVPTSRCLGGGSSVNFAMFTRAAASDYDDWETIHGNPGWGSDKLIPLLKKAETYQAPGDLRVHGTAGPIKVSYATDRNNIGVEFLEAAAKYDRERGHTADVSDFFKCNAYGRWPRYVDAVTGRRSDVPHNYIYNQSFPNLDIWTRRCVTRIVFENNCAIGVEHIDDERGRERRKPAIVMSRAMRLVVISAGAMGSPAILERSGIGSASVLEKNGVTQLVDLPGVGENYLDHNAVAPPYYASDDAHTLNVIFQGKEAELEEYVSEWSQSGRGLMSHNGCDAGIRIRPTSEDLKLIPEFVERWQTYFVDSPDKPVMVILAVASYLKKNHVNRKRYCLTYFTGYPISTGRVHIQSGTDPYVPLDFHPGYLDDPADVGVLRWAYKHARELARRMASYCGEFAAGHPNFPRGSEAAANESSTPVHPAAPKINYTPEDDMAIDDFHRKSVGTSWHSAGTCAMKPREKGGVLDPRLNVYGVRGLKVADCSIMPANVGANTCNTAIAIGEKAAVIIAQDLGIQGVTEEYSIMSRL